MKSNMNDVNGCLYHRIRMCIWKQWKRVRTRYRNLMGMGVPKDLAWKVANSRRGYWFTTHTVAINMAMTKERLRNKMTQSEWAESDEEAALIIEESFAKRISLSLIWVTSGGSFIAYLDDNDLFFGHSIAVNGSPKKGLLSADIEG